MFLIRTYEFSLLMKMLINVCNFNFQLILLRGNFPNTRIPLFYISCCVWWISKPTNSVFLVQSLWCYPNPWCLWFMQVSCLFYLMILWLFISSLTTLQYLCNNANMERDYDSLPELCHSMVEIQLKTIFMTISFWDVVHRFLGDIM